ncbi:MAG: hypothetical protein SFX74_03305, partial [Fimbriimonadaceae bacterium]|nr:hypothetical protein [Fimbriimonadaceae bacterium]
MAILDALIFNGPFVRMMGNLYERYSKVLAKRYTGQDVLEALPTLNGDATAAVRATLESSRHAIPAESGAVSSAGASEAASQENRAEDRSAAR